MIKQHQNQSDASQAQSQRTIYEGLKMTLKQSMRESMEKLKIEMGQLKKQHTLMQHVPEMIEWVHNQVNHAILTLANQYEQQIEQLNNRCQNLRVALMNSQQIKILQKNRLANIIVQKDQTISFLSYQLQRNRTQSAQSPLKVHPILNQQINSMGQQNTKLLILIEKYKKYIDNTQKRQQNKKEYSTNKESDQIITIAKRNNFLRQKYFQYRRQNDSLKSKIRSISKSLGKTERIYQNEYSKTKSKIEKKETQEIKKVNHKKSNTQSVSYQKQKVLTARGKEIAHKQIYLHTKSKYQNEEEKAPIQQIYQLLHSKGLNQKHKYTLTNSPQTREVRLPETGVISHFLSSLHSM